MKIYAGFWFAFVLPGFLMMYYWHDKLEFIEHFIFGIGISLATIGIFSYYLGLMGLNTKYHGYIIPLLLIIIGIFIIIKKIKEMEQSTN